jgi:hypothetical protein
VETGLLLINDAVFRRSSFSEILRRAELERRSRRVTFRATLRQQNQKTAANNGKQSKAVESHQSLNPIGLSRKMAGFVGGS